VKETPVTTKDPDSDRPKPKSRLDAELAEILERTDRPPSNVIKFRAKARTSRSWVQNLKSRFQQPSAGALLIASLALAIAGSLIHDSSKLAGSTLGVLSIICFIAVYVIGYRRPRGPQMQRWRGQDIRFGDPSRPSWMNRRPKPPKR
jgi:hypothetical protein